MLTSKVAKRYAQGLLDFSKDTGSIDAVFAEMKDVVKIMKQSKDLNSFLAAPFIDAKKKTEAAAQIFEKFSPATRNFITLIIKQGRESQLQRIAQEYINKVEDIEGVQRVTLTTAGTLNDNTIAEILKSTNLIDLNRKHDLTTIVNKDILGGYILRVGDQQVDASVKTKLGLLKKEFQLN